jgi:hypothetical protein
MNEIMLVWHSHIKLLNTKYPGHDIKTISPMTSDGHIQGWGMNWLLKFQEVETDLINGTYKATPKEVYIPANSRRFTVPPSPQDYWTTTIPGTKAHAITRGLIYPITPEDIRIAKLSIFSLPPLTLGAPTDPKIIENHVRFGYPIVDIPSAQTQNELMEKNNNVITENIKRKGIPKKIRGEAWKIQFGDSTKGSCFCCKKGLDVFDDWHAGHIVSHSNNGKDTADNLRPVCGSCNLSMGTENMDAFKARCYPN